MYAARFNIPPTITDVSFGGRTLAGNSRSVSRHPALTDSRLPENVVHSMSNAELQDEKTSLDEQVSTALRQNPYLQARSLRFETSAGRVTLRGQVTSWYQKQMAQEMLLRLDGVDRVENHLEVCRA